MLSYMSPEIYNLRLVIWDQCVVSAIHQTIQSFCQRTQYKKLALKNSFNLEARYFYLQEISKKFT